MLLNSTESWPNPGREQPQSGLQNSSFKTFLLFVSLLSVRLSKWNQKEFTTNCLVLFSGFLCSGSHYQLGRLVSREPVSGERPVEGSAVESPEVERIYQYTVHQ